MARPMKFLTSTSESVHKAVELPPPKPAPATGPVEQLTFPYGGSANVQVQLAGADPISASWMVPFAMPPPSALTGSSYNDGEWSLAVYISINGILLAGTTSYVSSSNGQLSYAALAYTGWMTSNGLAQKFLIQDFPIKPGDTITCSLCSLGSKTSGVASFMNVSTGTPYTMPTTAAVGELLNQSGDWGVFNEGTYSPRMPVFTPVLFSDCLVSNGPAEEGIGTGTLSNLVEDGNIVAKVALTGPEGFFVFPV